MTQLSVAVAREQTYEEYLRLVFAARRRVVKRLQTRPHTVAHAERVDVFSAEAAVDGELLRLPRLLKD